MVEVVSEERARGVTVSSRAAAMWALVATVALAAVLLSVVTVLPIGTYYWDIYFFVDAAHRIRVGEVPHQDFFLSVGALPYYLYELTQRIWPDGQPLLVGQYSLLLVTAPLMAAVILAADAEPGRVLAVVLPFAFFSLAPVNSNEFVTVPAVDGYGLYNRQAGLVLYVLASALALVRVPLALGSIAGLAAAALFFLKITGFVAGAGFILCAFLAGRLGAKLMGAGLVAFLVPVVVVEASLGIVSIYISDVLAMLAHNSGGLLRRVLRLISQELDLLAPLGILCIVLAFAERDRLLHSLRAPGLNKITGIFSLTAVQLALMTVFAIKFEMQNTGSQEFIYLWPLLSGILFLGKKLGGHVRLAVILLLALTALPTFSKAAHRLARAVAIMPAQVSLNLPELGVLNSVSSREEYIRRARLMREHYTEHSETYRTLVQEGEDPSFLYYTMPDTQLLYLIDLVEGMKAIQRHEQEAGVRYESIAGLDYVDPMPMLLGRKGAKGMPMGLDPTRGYPAGRHESYRAGLAEVDAIVEPLCPLLDQRADIRAIAEPVLAERRAVRIDPCWILYVKQ